MGQLWSTASLPERDQLAFWRDVVWQAFTPVSLVTPESESFVSSVAVNRAGPLQVATISSQPQQVSRTPALVASRPGDVFFVNLPLSDGTSGEQQGRTARLAAGDFVLLDGARPFDLRFTQPFRQVSVMVPHELLAPALSGRHAVTGVRVSGSTGIGAVASQLLRSVAARCDTIGQAEGRELARCVVELLALAVGGARQPPRTLERQHLRQAAVDAAEGALGDPELTCASVAERVGVSVRLLQRLFADEGSTFGRWLLQRRLELCHADLLDPARSGWTVAEIASAHGLCDPSYFSRAFKARYGTTPRALRATALPRGGDGLPAAEPA